MTFAERTHTTEVHRRAGHCIVNVLRTPSLRRTLNPPTSCPWQRRGVEMAFNPQRLERCLEQLASSGNCSAGARIPNAGARVSMASRWHRHRSRADLLPCGRRWRHRRRPQSAPEAAALRLIARSCEVPRLQSQLPWTSPERSIVRRPIQGLLKGHWPTANRWSCHPGTAARATAFRCQVRHRTYAR